MKKIIILLVAIFCLAETTNAQHVESNDYAPKKNLVKVNLTSLLLRNYSAQYERVLSKIISVAISYRKMPEGNIPFKSQVLNSLEQDDTETREIVENFKLSNYAITPEIRFYLGKKGYGRGFYIAPFYRNAGYNGNNFRFTYEGDDMQEQSMTLSGDVTSNTFGIMIGAQWSLSEHLLLDWFILGPHGGNGNGALEGVSSTPLSEMEQNEIREVLEDVDIPLIEKSVEVNSAGAKVNFDGFWGGLRAGISLGIKF
jgi:hypothetical protein